MSRVILLDSGPLSLVTHRVGVRAADDCRTWLAQHLVKGERVVVAEVVDYELRRELMRAKKHASVASLDAFIASAPGRYLPLTTPAMRLAADLWADVRQRGIPTTGAQELDIDVILAAQALSMGVARTDVIVATTNVAHLSRLVQADLWQNI